MQGLFLFVVVFFFPALFSCFLRRWMFGVDTETILFVVHWGRSDFGCVCHSKTTCFFLVLVVYDEVHLTASIFSYRCGGGPILGKDHPTADKVRTASVSVMYILSYPRCLYVVCSYFVFRDSSFLIHRTWESRTTLYYGNTKYNRWNAHVCLHPHTLKFNPDMCTTMVDNISLEHLDIIDLTVTSTEFTCHLEQGCELVLQHLTFKCFILVSSFLLLSLPIHRITN